MRFASRWILVSFGVLLAAYALLPLVAKTRLPINPPGLYGPPWWREVGFALLLAMALALRVVPSGRQRTRLLRLLGVTVIYLLYTGNQAIRSAEDNIPNRELPWLVVAEQSLDIAAASPLRGRELPYYAVAVGDRVLSAFPLGTAFLAVPYAALGLQTMGRPPEPTVALKLEKHFAALLTTAACMLFFLAVRSRFSEGVALAATGVFALATPLVTCASQGMWSVTGETFFVALALLLILPDDASALQATVAGAAMGGAFFCRPSALLIAVALGGLLVAEGRRRLGIRFAVGCALAVTAVCVFLFSLYGHPLGGYASLNLRSGMWSLAHLPDGLAGNLFSPSRGLLVHLPWLLLAPLGLKRAPKPVRLLWLVSLGLVAVFLLLAGGYVKWWGGFSIGPRLQTESAAFAALLLLPALVGYATLAKGWRTLLLALLGFAGATQLLGAYRDQASAWNEVVDPDHRPEKLWSVRDSQLVATWSPRWNISLEPYEPLPLSVRQRGPWIAVDLSGVANARYDGDPFVCAASSSKFPHYPRLDPQVVSRPGRFEFAPRGRPNAVTICRDAEAVQIPLPRVRAHALYGLLAAGGASETESERIAATAVVRFTNGTAQVFPLRLNREVFEYRTHLRHPPLPDLQVYAGRPDDPDVLAWTAFRIHRRGRTLESFELVRQRGTRIGVTLLALSVETASVESRDSGHRPAAP